MHLEKKRGLLAKIIPVFFHSTLQLCSSKIYISTLEPFALLESGTMQPKTVMTLALIPVPLARRRTVWGCVAPPAAVGSGYVGIAATTLVAMTMIFVAGRNLFVLSACFLSIFGVKALTTVRDVFP